MKINYMRQHLRNQATRHSREVEVRVRVEVGVGFGVKVRAVAPGV
jgi:hypothetical protein